ncbi:ChaN family lipoprotein [Sulfitobacter sp. D35]|uniref:ChaN family lipoprotein n=1 Tax=Sulfitobacter sp. D35 TaxID=3083252 RepID=UPI00296EAEEA|nr:ChaN family lipoprotein [Sulfitobacter sp. D35]MDW4499016.1 ChaN family lipoprotein [Sulfitobacter sp. D35]
MTFRPGSICLAAALWAALCVSAPADPPPAAREAQIVFLGEAHDNPGHHARQAEWVAALEPQVLVFEMLTEDQARQVTPEVRRDAEELAKVLDWDASGWPDFAMYFPIFEAAPEAEVLGAGVPREGLDALMEGGLAAAAGVSGARFGLADPLPEDQQVARMDLQRAAHCDALPEDMLPTMVDVQRLRDAALAEAALQALERTGGPVAVITGNGHARTDWGAPALVQRAAPSVVVFALGQGEASRAPEGSFSQVADAEPVDRGDPCDAFKR